VTTVPKRKVAMCLMAHPDDCEILAAGTMLALKDKGWELHIVTMSPGDCGSAELGPGAIADVRRGEGHAAAEIGGATYHCLESRDLAITYDEPTIRRALALTRHIGPTLMFTHSLTCYMMDHEVTARLARSASFGYAIPNAVSGSAPDGAQVPWLYYADPIEGVDPYGNDVTPSTVVDITATMDTKTEMLKAHESQREWLRAHHGMDQYIVSMQQWGEKRGSLIGAKFAEGFRQHKGHPYPHDCLLRAELGGLVHHF